MPMIIEVGQHWRTRSGDVVRVTADRHHPDYSLTVAPGANHWRWALSNSQIACEEGRVGLNGDEHPSDLMELILGDD